jgi:Tfp pilus assembly PilM family ATPase
MKINFDKSSPIVKKRKQSVAARLQPMINDWRKHFGILQVGTKQLLGNTSPFEPVVGIEINERFVKIVRADRTKPGGARLVTLNIEGYSEEEISRQIISAFTKENIGAHSVLLNFPRQKGIVKFFDLPSTQDGEIESMVKMEIVRQLPHTSEETVSGYRVIEKRPDGYSRLMLAVAQISEINWYLRILKKANLGVGQIALGSETLLEWVYLASGKISSLGDGLVGVINVDPEYIHIVVLQNKKLTFTRAILPLKGQETQSDKILDEVVRSLATYERRSNVHLARLWICGAEELAQTAKTHLHQQLDIPIEMIDLFAGSSREAGNYLADQGVSCVELLGLVFKKENIKINLLPVGVQRGNDQTAGRKRLTKSLLLFSFFILLLAFLVMSKLLNQSRFLQYLDKELQVMAPQVTKAKTMKDNLTILQSEFGHFPLAVDIVSAVYAMTPPGIIFSLLDYDAGESLLLKGSAPALTDVLEFTSILEESPLFQNARIKYSTQRTKAAAPVTDFEIVCSLEKGLR